LYLLTWLVLDGHAPSHLTARAGCAILYLSLMGSVVGFMLFYYLLKQVTASRTALITLVTPVIALWLGQTLNGEHIAPRIWLGTALILAGLVAHQWGDRVLQRESSNGQEGKGAAASALAQAE
jgi:drug/metabolite transporter (DMT)-like permease